MTIYFGLSLDDQIHPPHWQVGSGVSFVGPQGLLRLLEARLGLTLRDTDNDHLRIEQYRQALLSYVATDAEAFYISAFEADELATAADILSRRDELLMAGWDFIADASTPLRLRQIAAIEQLLRAGDLALSPGYADRFEAVLHALDRRRHDLKEIRLGNPLEYLPVHFRRLLAKMESQGLEIQPLAPAVAEAPAGSDLGLFQRKLLDASSIAGRTALKGDGSLLILRGSRESDLAAYVAQLARNNSAFHPLCLIADKRRSLDDAIIQEGLPSMGLLSTSLSRPTLQVLKLVTAFLWQPADPYKIMEFVSLPVKPLEEELSYRIAAQMASTPGINSESWYAMVRRYFEELEAGAIRANGLSSVAVRKQYDFWFERKRYDIQQVAPKEDAIEIFSYLEEWAWRTFDEGGGKNLSLLVLQQQARRVRELLEALPETDLPHLSLERIVRTIYQPAPVQFNAVETGALHAVHMPGAVYGATEELLWWNFLHLDAPHFFSRWYYHERNWLQQSGIQLIEPQEENEMDLWQRKQPLLWTRKRAILVVPDTVEGETATPHPLLGDMEAAFGDLSPITLRIGAHTVNAAWQRSFHLPGYVLLPTRQLGRPQPFLRIPNADRLAAREEETFTSLDALLYYPYQWVFRHQIKLVNSSILSLVKDRTLMGNLAHRFFERLLRQDIYDWSRQDVVNWIDKEAGQLLHKEGAVLLMYGREPERVAFINRIKYAAWSLVSLIVQNGWRVAATEHPLEGGITGLKLNGRADLILERGGEIAVVDLKWSGANFRQSLIRNEEDLQLVLYSRLLSSDNQWAHTAYFIMESGKLIARNALAFKEAVAVSPQSDHIEVNQRIMQRLEATYSWRLSQIQEGLVEVRCRQTLQSLEDHYGESLLSLLEMKSEDARFDDYRTLLDFLG